MARNLAVLVRSLVRHSPPAEGEPLPDAELLARFARSRDQAAFELLVWRHGAMVLGVCRRVLRDHHLAEDAFQASFLVLARRAGSVRANGSAAGYLHRIARRVALRAARQRRPIEALTIDPPDRVIPERDDELRAILDAEIDRLPDRFRVPLVLCYLDGCSTADAARELGLPRGTVLSRLATARAKLATRLTRRGLTIPAVLGSTATCTLTSDRVGACIGAATAFASGIGTESTALVLANGVMQMSLRKTTAVWSAVLLLTGGLATGVGVLAGGQGPGPSRPVAAEQNPRPRGTARNDATPLAGATTPERDQQLGDERRDRLQELLERTRHDVEHKSNQLRALRTESVDPLILKSRSDALARIELEIFQTQLELRKHEMMITVLKSRITADERTPIPEDVITDALRTNPTVRQAQEALDKAMALLKNLIGNVKDPESNPDFKRLKATLAGLTEQLDEARTNARPQVERQIRASRNETSRNSIAVAEIDIQVKKGLLEVLKKEKEEFLRTHQASQRIAQESESLQSEIDRGKELMDRLAREVADLEIQRRGGVRETSRNETDAKLDRILRELAELRAEIKALKERR